MILRKFVRTVSLQADNFRHSLAYIDALPQLTILGAVVGLCTGAIIILFRFCIIAPLSFLPEHADNFEALTVTTRITLIFVGAIALIITLQLFDKNHWETSVAHVLDRLHSHQGKLPGKNWLLQFLGATIALITGHSVGREGPAVHLGATAASKLGQWLRLPHNSLHTLIGCGVAAAISAAFDTPMAGVIFALEVLLLEYSIVGFVPIIMASVIGAVMSQATFGTETSFMHSQSDINSLAELPYMIVVGLVIALFASTLIKLNLHAMKFSRYAITWRILAAAALTALVATEIPEVMGLGYDTAQKAINGELGFDNLIFIALGKLLLTPIIIGLGIPGGIIGPLLVGGACLGGAMGVIATLAYPDLVIHLEIYVILGMVGMMAATLNAPLAALVAVLELSYNSHMIFPAMLVIVISCVCTRHLFKLEGIFIEQLKLKGKSLKQSPAERALGKAGVRSIMDTQFCCTPAIIDYEQAKTLLSSNPNWIVIEHENHKTALRAAGLAVYLESASEEVLSLEKEIDLEDIPGKRSAMLPIHENATLKEALQAFANTGTNTLYVARNPLPLHSSVEGIVLRSSIENYYQPEEFKHHAVD